MKKVLVRGPAISQSGYGEHTRFVLRSLRSHPDIFDVYLINVNWGQTGWIFEDTEERRWMDFLLSKTIQHTQQGGQFDISLQVTIPNEWEKLAPVNIGVTAGIETTKIAPGWVEKSLQMDKIIVVSEHAKFGFDNTEYPATNNVTGEQFLAKSTCPIEVVGYPVKNIEPVNLDLDLKHDFNFLTVGTWIARKNLERTITWFVEEFYDQEVGLIVKTSLAKNCLRDRTFAHQRLQELLKEHTGRKCEVYLLHGDMSESEMTGLYQHPQVKAMINLSHGEGFGLPLFEAAYNGLPVIAPNWSGQVDFLHMPVKDKKGKVKNKAMFSEIAFDIKPIQPEAHWEGVIQKDSMWCFPKEWNYKKTLRQVYKNIGAANADAKKLQKWVQETFEESVQYQKLCNSVYEPTKEEEEWNSLLNEVQMI
jgi:glycosyltransferase involved in cell wall biosynthesis